MKKRIVCIITLAFVIGIAGCAVLPMESNLKKPVSMSQETEKRGESFVVNKRCFWLVGGIAPLMVPEIDELIGSKAVERSGIQNLKITTQFDVIDIIINVATSGIIYSRSITVEGEAYD